jgi:nitronate monooxygenase
MALSFLGGRRVVLAPMAGGPGTPALAAAVAAGGGFPVLPSGYASIEDVAATTASFRSLSGAAYAVNLFVPAPLDEGRLRAARVYAGVVARWAEDHGLPVGEPRYDDDAFAAKLDLVLRERPAAVTFAFGLPDAETVQRLRDRGIASLVTVTSPDEAAEAARRRVDGLVVQGEEAGSHRGGWRGGTGDLVALLPLLGLVREATDLPMIAAGGVAAAERASAALDAGAVAVAAGTAFLLTPQAGTSAVHRAALAGDRSTVLTRAFTGKAARALRNAFTDALDGDAPDGYPEVHHLTSATRAAAREHGEVEAVNLWAGRAYREARAESADLVVRRLLPS